MKKLIMLLVLFCGCADYAWGNRVEVVLSDKYDSAMYGEWQGKVAQSAQIWNDILEPDCGFRPFPMNEGADAPLFITLYAPEEWAWAGAIGSTPTHDDVQVEGPKPGQALGTMIDVVLHEMGHVMNLHHVNDPTSVMNPNNTNTVPNRNDIKQAKINLGCIKES